MSQNQTLSDALLVWTGWGYVPWPDDGEKRLEKKFGLTAARALLPKLQELKNEFYSSNAWQVASDLPEMQTMSAAEFRPRHPEISEDAVRALAWCYTFDYK